CQQFTTSPWTF
nr:immunoglobulin light chain junction region [Mus musculus]NSL97642.1 immunoglobulin light chain junction region [Mus musculus]NSL97810.1 immunoglobulin light chain junction region [Mus musculus]NSL98061.1 immunoglobulin light chain junction region [Mus musculus]NSL98679.1 immunoglobulin light chain junction region [Mus musculus]